MSVLICENYKAFQLAEWGFGDLLSFGDNSAQLHGKGRTDRQDTSFLYLTAAQ